MTSERRPEAFNFWHLAIDEFCFKWKYCAHFPIALCLSCGPQYLHPVFCFLNPIWLFMPESLQTSSEEVCLGEITLAS